MELVVTNGEDYLMLKEIKKAKKGNKASFSNIIMKNEKTMYRVAKNYLSRNEDILDAMSETTLKAFKSIDTLKNESYFKTWLIKILINECLMIIRKNNNQYLDDNCLIIDEGHSDTYENIDLTKALDLLPEKFRLTLILYYYEDFSIKEISKTLNMNENTIKTNLKRGREELYSILGEDYYEETYK